MSNGYQRQEMNITNYPDKEAGVFYCSRCETNNSYYYTFFRVTKYSGYYIKFCRKCCYGNYNDCSQEIRDNNLEFLTD